ncbi:MAG TPA: Clp protease N-terminal domain-containing protein, partial [Polyangia bacterium]
MNFDFLTPEGKRALVAAQKLARTREQEAVEPEHLLLALLDQAEPSAVLETAGADLAALRSRLEAAVRALPKVVGGTVYLGDRVLRLLDIAQVDARERGEANVGPVHLLAGIPLETRSTAAELLRERGVTLPKLEDTITKRTAKPGAVAAAAVSATNSSASATSATATPGEPTPLLDKYARDLTARAAAGQIDPVVGRDAETRRVMQILGRRGKNNPLLVGDPGVGKTAIVEGLAARIASGDVPASLLGKRLLALDIGALVAGAKFRGEFEDRVRGIIAEVNAHSGQLLLFFDEIHTLIGAGQGEGGVDAADLLKPALARGELTCIGATTIDEYRLHIEKDAAFERRFLPVEVEQPNEEICIAMLRAVKRR